MTWRLIDLELADGPSNMAVDEALLDAVAAGLAPLTLRFYGWMKPCISIGCAQTVGDLDLSACREAGLPIVRRASGGTAVLHEAALGFSLAIPASSPLAVPDVVESYRLLGSPVWRALESLGVSCRLVLPAEAHLGARPTGLGSGACFASLAPYEVVRDGKKIVGNSQIRRRGAVLHHVMLPLAFDAARFARFLAVGSPEERRELAAYLEARIGGFEPNPPDPPSPRGKGGAVHRRPAPTAGDKPPPYGALEADVAGCAPAPREQGVGLGDLVAALMEAFASAFGADLEAAGLTEGERTAAVKLVGSKYANDEWTYRR